MQLYAYACGTNSIFDSLWKPGPNLYEPMSLVSELQASSLGLGQVTSLLSELEDMPLDTTLMMH